MTYYPTGSELLDELKDLAKEMGCTAMGWTSKRIGYLRKVKKYASEIQSVEFRISLGDK